jgi:ubiquitin
VNIEKQEKQDEQEEQKRCVFCGEKILAIAKKV